ncbi:MAG TPA: hypothetical protein RMH99_29675 [Sandaracinaceae bacterium LLY-WYZ-13_1]|nr:hypothetical protein [Sandaracinaceae bacterium LLY-WYZ-13_1]
MFTRTPALLCTLTLVFAAGCDGEEASPPPEDAGRAPARDAGRAPTEDAGSPGDAGTTPTPDAGEATGCGDVAGTYEMTWTADPSNPPDCLSPSDTVTILDDGLDTGSPASTCEHSACDATRCVRMVLDTCEASMTVTGPCAGLEDGRRLSVFNRFSDGTLSSTVADEGSPTGTCRFEGTGTRASP